MFFPRSLPLALDDASLLGLRVALNTPVISIQELPNGPATAAIAVHLEEGGERALTVALRALRTGETVLYTLDEDLSIEGAVQGAIDAALSFSEAMGFLFDDEMLETDTPANRRRAITRWREVVGEAGPAAAGAPGRPAVPDEAHDEAEELVLEEAVTLEEPVEVQRAPEPARARKMQPAQGAARSMPLTKFRKRADSAPPEASPPVGAAAPAGAAVTSGAPSKVLMTPHGPALGRLQLVKRRRAGDDPAPPSWLARLLGSF